MKKQGTVVRWDDAKGFGFIRGTGAQDIFFHVRDFRAGSGAIPRQGMKVTFEEIHVGGKGPRAMAVQPAGMAPAASPKPSHPPRPPRPHPAAPGRPTPSRPASGAWIALPLMAAYTAALVWAAWTKLLPGWVLPASLLLNLAVFFVYWKDKYAAGTGQWRTKEDTLHLWSLLGGWGGAWFAQQVLRHKSRKGSFLQVYWFTVVAHCAAVGWWLYRAGA